MSTTSLTATLGTAFGTINATLNSAVTVLNVGNTYISKAQLAADDSYRNQKVQSTIDNAVTQERLIREAAMSEAESAQKIKTFCAKSEFHSKSYSDSYDRFQALFQTAQ